MSNAVATQSGGAVGNVAHANPFAVAGAGSGNSIFVKFTGASGDYSYGQDDDELEHGTHLAADIANASYSWAFWWDGEVLETRTIRVDEDPRSFEREPDDFPEDYDGDMTIEEIRAERKRDPANFRDGWSVQGCVNLRATDGDMEEYTLKLNAGVALRSFLSMLNAYGRVFMQKPGKQPIIELGARKFKSKNKAVGTRYAPDLKIVDWLSEEDLMNSAGEDPGDYEDEGELPDDAQAKALEAPADEAPETDEKPASRRGARRGRGNF